MMNPLYLCVAAASHCGTSNDHRVSDHDSGLLCRTVPTSDALDGLHACGVVDIFLRTRRRHVVIRNSVGYFWERMFV